MNYTLIKDYIDLLEEFETEAQICPDLYPVTIQGLKHGFLIRKIQDRKMIRKNRIGKVKRMEEPRKVL